MNPRARLRPLKGKVILEPQEPRTHSDGGIEIPEAYREIDGVESIVRGIHADTKDFVLGDRVVTSKRAPGMKMILHPRKLKVMDAAQVKAVFI